MGSRQLHSLRHLCRAVISFTTADAECVVVEINLSIVSLTPGFMFNQELGPVLQNPECASETQSSHPLTSC